jgi:hypothetical protein
MIEKFDKDQLLASRRHGEEMDLVRKEGDEKLSESETAYAKEVEKLQQRLNQTAQDLEDIKVEQSQRQSRPEDLERIHYLQNYLRDLKKKFEAAREETLYFKRELSNRDENFTRTFLSKEHQAKHPIKVGVLNVLPPASNTTTTGSTSDTVRRSVIRRRRQHTSSYRLRRSSSSSSILGQLSGASLLSSSQQQSTTTTSGKAKVPLSHIQNSIPSLLGIPDPSQIIQRKNSIDMASTTTGRRRRSQQQRSSSMVERTTLKVLQYNYIDMPRNPTNNNIPH